LWYILKEGERVEPVDYFKSLGEGESGEVRVYYKVGNEYRPIRICAQRKREEAEKEGLESLGNVLDLLL
jgi:hypothetical protein